MNFFQRKPNDEPTAATPMRQEELGQITENLSHSKSAMRLAEEVRRCWRENASLKAQIAEIARQRAKAEASEALSNAL